MKIQDKIRQFFIRRQYHVLRQFDGWNYGLPVSGHPFGDTIFLNIVELLTDIYSEVVWSSETPEGIPVPETARFKAWKKFVDTNGQRILVQLYYKRGYAVIAWKRVGDSFVFWEMKSDEYKEKKIGDEVIVVPDDPNAQCYVLKSPTYEATGRSDKELCNPYIKYLDNVLNGSSTLSERLGAVVIGSPETPSNAPAPTKLNATEKKALEEQIETQYGSLRRQRQIMLLPNGMKFQVINLAGLDDKLTDKTRIAILAICDRVKVPANQVAIIDANSSKSLSNGTELREGDLAKYRSFRRLLNATWYDMATEIGLQANYTIENEPRTTQGQTIEQ